MMRTPTLRSVQRVRVLVCTDQEMNFDALHAAIEDHCQHSLADAPAVAVLASQEAIARESIRFLEALTAADINRRLAFSVEHFTPTITTGDASTADLTRSSSVLSNSSSSILSRTSSMLGVPAETLIKASTAFSSNESDMLLEKMHAAWLRSQQRRDKAMKSQTSSKQQRHALALRQVVEEEDVTRGHIETLERAFLSAALDQWKAAPLTGRLELCAEERAARLVISDECRMLRSEMIQHQCKEIDALAVRTMEAIYTPRPPKLSAPKGTEAAAAAAEALVTGGVARMEADKRRGVQRMEAYERARLLEARSSLQMVRTLCGVPLTDSSPEAFRVRHVLFPARPPAPMQ